MHASKQMKLSRVLILLGLLTEMEINIELRYVVVNSVLKENDIESN